MAGCLIRGRRRWSVTYTSPTRTTYFRIWNRNAFQERKPYPFPGRLKNSPYYCPGRGANPRPPAHPDFLTSKCPTPYSLGLIVMGRLSSLIIYVLTTGYPIQSAIKHTHFTKCAILFTICAIEHTHFYQTCYETLIFTTYKIWLHWKCVD